MKHSFFILLFLCCCGFAQAQTDSLRLIGIHPAVGKTVDRGEKIKYQLFPEYKDSIFDHAQVFTKGDTAYQLVITSIRGTQVKYAIDTTAMNTMYDQVEKVERAQQTDDKAVAKHNSDNDFWFDLLGQAIYLTIDLLVSLL